MIQPRPTRLAAAAFALALSTLAFLPATARAADHKAPPVQPATDFTAVEVHADEHLAVAAEPYDTHDKSALFRIDYLAHGVIPIRLIVTNLGDKPVSLKDARIIFVTAQGDRIQAADPEDVERLISLHDKQGTKIPLPGPLPSIHLKPKASDKDVEQDFDQFEYQALVVEPHSTQAGFLFYDVSGLTHPLKGATLNLRKLRTADGQELFAFEISFDKYLKSKSPQMN